MSFNSENELNRNGKSDKTVDGQDQFSLSPRKRSCRSSSQHFDQDDQTNSSSNAVIEHFLSKKESKSSSNKKTEKNIFQLNKDDDNEDRQEEAYSPSQLDPAMMEEVSEQLKFNEHSCLSNKKMKTYIPSSMNFIAKDKDYREKRTSNETISSHCRLIPIHLECSNIVDPRLRIHSTRLRSKVRQLVLQRISKKNSSDRNEILEELDHLVESHGRRFYWYRVICFLQNISLTNNTHKQIQIYLKELARLLVLTPKICKILKIKQKYPKSIPIEYSNTDNNNKIRDPRSNHFQPKLLGLKSIHYD